VLLKSPFPIAQFSENSIKRTMLDTHEIRNRQGERLDHAFQLGTRTGALIILGHGVTGDMDRPLLVAVAAGLVACGWPCLRISYSGNGGSEGQFTKSCISKEIGDLQAVLDAIPNEVKIAYVGHSMGAAVGVLTAARDLRIRLLVSLAGMTHTAAFVSREFSEIIPDHGVMWESPECPLSSTYVDDLTRIETTLPAAEALIQPWFLIHGGADDVVPIQDGKDAFEAAMGDKKWLELAAAGHCFDETSYPIIVAALDAWLSQHFDKFE
jgi:uncharacterized protein